MGFGRTVHEAGHDPGDVNSVNKTAKPKVRFANLRIRLQTLRRLTLSLFSLIDLIPNLLTFYHGMPAQINRDGDTENLFREI